MPVKTLSNQIIEITLTECVGRKCDDGRFHVILKDGTHGIWISNEEAQIELSRKNETLDELLTKNEGRRIKF